MQDASLWEIRELFGTKHLELLAYVRDRRSIVQLHNNCDTSTVTRAPVGYSEST